MSAARACLVTGYIRLDLPNRSHEEYERLGAELLTAAGVPAFVFTDCDRVLYRRRVSLPTTVLPAGVTSCWHWRLSDGATLPIGNAEKDTRAFHAVQHEKTAWVAAAADHTDAEILVWMDYGILHVPGITPAIVEAFLGRAAWKAPRDRVGMASIWGKPYLAPLPNRVHWHCAGGVFTVPRHLARPWHDAVVKAATQLRAYGWATWEVNDWAAAWVRNPGMVRMWECDHGATLLENGP